MTRLWQGRHAWPLLPLSALFGGLAAARRLAYRRAWLTSERLPVPVVVVGNISVGGTGKTPLTHYLARALGARGHLAAVVSRGYGGRVDGVAEVDPRGPAELFGDEPLLLARHSGVPVFVGRDRVAAARALLVAYPRCSVILCDDGLQHYRLARDIEIAVIDGQRGLGNGWLLPAGPLREPPARLGTVDAVVINGGAWPAGLPQHRAGFAMQLRSDMPYRIDRPEQQRPLESFRGEPLAAVAGIGHPPRFFAALRAAGLEFEAFPYPDHHPYCAADLARWRGRTVLTTEKDAVKLESLAAAAGDDGKIWALPVAAEVTPDLADWLLARLPPPPL
ncbi:tetraacyldisaccharide 4'-kinase [Chitinimonas lacunae]|uniref:Tetraacyldisaccharide 4'-kinase n=1 Tax=Chitinimonas lacunae TaxID=1963018 RepID=A0ABV8MS41_9NEIS